MTNDERNRIQTEYERRAQAPELASKYSVFNNEYLFMLQNREKAFLSILKQHQSDHLSPLKILDLGCGIGQQLQALISYGAKPHNLTGIDLMPNRLIQAKAMGTQIGLAQADATTLPFPNKSFDLILQFTVFTSILQNSFKQTLAAEMLRTLQPNGKIIWYDFWANNPANPNVQGIKPTEIKALFPHCTYHFQRVTLAPPIARRVVPFSWLLAELLSKIPWLLTHYFVIIEKK